MFDSINNLRLATHLKVSHYYAPFEKSHMVGHHLIFVDHRENVFDFDIDMKMFYLNWIWNCFNHI